MTMPAEMVADARNLLNILALLAGLLWIMRTIGGLLRQQPLSLLGISIACSLLILNNFIGMMVLYWPDNPAEKFMISSCILLIAALLTLFNFQFWQIEKSLIRNSP